MSNQWKPHKKPNYVDKVAKAALKLNEAGCKPGVYHVHVYHSSWCDMVKGKGPCNCDPDVAAPFKEGSQN